ncbi:MAG TPA: PstA family ABC transporter permease [Pirellulaceae bacterium]|nr:PstA family ABC transporter permease [Pirellulaceae bacterium]
MSSLLSTPNSGMHPIGEISRRTKVRDRRWVDAAFRWFCVATALLSVLILVVLLVSILIQGYARLSWHFLQHYPEPEPRWAGIGPALWGTVWVCCVCGLFALPIGVATAIFLEEFPPQRWWTRKLHNFIQLNISNLAGVPSVVYGILGLTLFVSLAHLAGTPNQPAWEIGVRYYDQFWSLGDRAILVPITDPNAPPTLAQAGMQAQDYDGHPVAVTIVPSRREAADSPEMLQYTLIEGRVAGRITKSSWYHLRLPLGRSVLAAALTLMLVILPIVIIASQEALRGVPSSLREAGLGVGATPWQVVRHVTLPAAIPGIMTGSILAMSRAIGEAAPILIMAGAVFISTSPSSLVDEVTVMPLQIYDWASRPQAEFHELAATGILVLLAVLLLFNSLAVYIRQRTQKPLT